MSTVPAEETSLPVSSHTEEDLYPYVPLVDDPRTGPGPGAEETEDGVKLWYPPADRKFSMRVKGRYEKGYPVGAVVHSTEGRSKNGDTDAENTIEGTGIPNGHCYFCISGTGKVYQSFLLDRWGIHCGKTFHPELGFALDDKLVGIEVCAAGIVQKIGDNKYKPDWNEIFTDPEVRFSEKIENIQQSGHYVRFNEAQEKALFDLLVWLKTNNPGVFNLNYVFGHDEIATLAAQGHPGDQTLGRKQDPGAGLSAYMREFRAKLLAAMPTV